MQCVFFFFPPFPSFFFSFLFFFLLLNFFLMYLIPFFFFSFFFFLFFFLLLRKHSASLKDADNAEDKVFSPATQRVKRRNTAILALKRSLRSLERLVTTKGSAGAKSASALGSSNPLTAGDVDDYNSRDSMASSTPNSAFVSTTQLDDDDDATMGSSSGSMFALPVAGGKGRGLRRDDNVASSTGSLVFPSASSRPSIASQSSGGTVPPLPNTAGSSDDISGAAAAKRRSKTSPSSTPTKRRSALFDTASSNGAPAVRSRPVSMIEASPTSSARPSISSSASSPQRNSVASTFAAHTTIGTTGTLKSNGSSTALAGGSVAPPLPAQQPQQALAPPAADPPRASEDSQTSAVTNQSDAPPNDRMKRRQDSLASVDSLPSEPRERSVTDSFISASAVGSLVTGKDELTIRLEALRARQNAIRAAVYQAQSVSQQPTNLGRLLSTRGTALGRLYALRTLVHVTLPLVERHARVSCAQLANTVDHWNNAIAINQSIMAGTVPFAAGRPQRDNVAQQGVIAFSRAVRALIHAGAVLNALFKATSSSGPAAAAVAAAAAGGPQAVQQKMAAALENGAASTLGIGADFEQLAEELEVAWSKIASSQVGQHGGTMRSMSGTVSTASSGDFGSNTSGIGSVSADIKAMRTQMLMLMMGTMMPYITPSLVELSQRAASVPPPPAEEGLYGLHPGWNLSECRVIGKHMQLRVMEADRFLQISRALLDAAETQRLSLSAPGGELQMAQVHVYRANSRVENAHDHLFETLRPGLESALNKLDHIDVSYSQGPSTQIHETSQTRPMSSPGPSRAAMRKEDPVPTPGATTAPLASDKDKEKKQAKMHKGVLSIGPMLKRARSTRN
jgi:hypothetical protein